MIERIALFDLDGSLADYDLALRRDLLSLMSPAELELGQRDLWRVERHSYIHNRMQMIKNQPGWWLSLPRIEAGFEIVQMAMDIGYNVQILTKGPGSHPAAWKEKLEWCQQQPELKNVPVHIVSDKSLVYGHVLYDDYPSYLDSWLSNRVRGFGIMPVTDYNKSYYHERVIHWSKDSADERTHIRSVLELMYNRKPKEMIDVPRMV